MFGGPSIFREYSSTRSHILTPVRAEDGLQRAAHWQANSEQRDANALLWLLQRLVSRGKQASNAENVAEILGKHG